MKPAVVGAACVVATMTCTAAHAVPVPLAKNGMRTEAAAFLGAKSLLTSEIGRFVLHPEKKVRELLPMIEGIPRALWILGLRPMAYSPAADPVIPASPPEGGAVVDTELPGIVDPAPAEGGVPPLLSTLPPDLGETPIPASAPEPAGLPAPTTVVAAVPEPSSLWLAVCGVAAVLLVRRRRQRV